MNSPSLKKIALVLAYSFVVAFGTATTLIVQDRALDGRGELIIATMCIGALFGSTIAILKMKRLSALPPVLCFLCVFLGVTLLTLIGQAFLAGILFNFTDYIDHDTLFSSDGILELIFTSVYGFAYYFIYGSPLVLPVGFFAGLLFSLGFLTLRPRNGTYR